MRTDGRAPAAVSDFFDFSVYVDAPRRGHPHAGTSSASSGCGETAFADPESYFHRYAALTDDEARATAAAIWEQINEPNLVENILPTRGRATLVLTKGADHAVHRIRLRKL